MCIDLYTYSDYFSIGDKMGAGIELKGEDNLGGGTAGMGAESFLGEGEDD